MEGGNARTNDDINTRKRIRNENKKKQEQQISSPSLYRPTNIVIDANTTTNHANTNTAAPSSSSGVVVVVVKFTDIVIRPLIINSLTYLDPESLRQVCLVSHEFHDMVHTHPGLQQRMFAVFQLHFSNDRIFFDGKRLEMMLVKLNRRRRSILHLYRKMKITTARKFCTYFLLDTSYAIMEDLRFDGIVSLDLSLPKPTATNGFFSLRDIFTVMTQILPNLRELDLSNTKTNKEELHYFCTQNPRLEKITWHNNGIQLQSRISLDGRDMESIEILREIHMDNTVFITANFFSRFSDLEDTEHSDIFLFHRCRKSLVHVSIRNAKHCKTYSNTPCALPQNALIKFIRNALPSLKSFRSDLTQQNIDMLLQSDDGPRFSEIEFLT